MPNTLNHINRIKSIEEIRQTIEDKFENEWKIAELEVFKIQHEEKLKGLEKKLRDLASNELKQIRELKGKKSRREKKLSKTKNETTKQNLTTEIEEIDEDINNLNDAVHQIAKENKIGKKSLNRLIKNEKHIIEVIEEEQSKLESKTLAIEPAEKNVEYNGAGAYVVHVFGKDVRFLIVENEEDFKNVHNLVLSNIISLRKINQQIYDAWQKAVEVSTKLEMSPGELFALAQVKGEWSEKLSENIRMDLESFAKTYGSISMSLAGIFMEIGAGAEVNIRIGNDTIGYNAKLYAKAKAGVYVSPTGVEASAGAEAGSEHSISFTPPPIGKYSMEVNGKFKAYGKAEAKALAKLTGGGAKAVVAVGVAANLEGVLKYGGNIVGSIEAEGSFELELGVGAVAKIDLKTGNLTNEGNVPMRIFEVGVEIEIAALAGVSVIAKGSIKIAEHLVEAGKKQLKKELSDLVKDAILKLTNEKVLAILIEIKDEIDHYVGDVTSIMGHHRNNITNLIDKAIIALQTEHKNKVKLEFERHENKLARYKKHVDDAIAALEDKISTLGENTTLESREIDLFIKGSEDETFKRLLKDFHRNEPRKIRDLINELQKYVVKYNTRIDKYITFINSEFSSYADRIEKHYVEAKKLIEEFRELDSVTDKEREETREKINQKLNKINSLVTTFNLISETKQAVIEKAQEFSSDEEEEDVDSVEIAAEIRKTYNSLNRHINRLARMVGKVEQSLR